MSRLVQLIIVVLAMFCYLTGCGSSNGTNSSFTIQDSSTRFTPKSTTIQTGNKVQFINTDSQNHQIFSGTLEPQGSASVIHTIIIGNTGFSPASTDGNLGDTVIFSNNQTGTFTLDIVNDNGTVISSFSISAGQMQNVDFPGAGLFTYRNHNNSLFNGNIILYGSPNPDGIFFTPVMSNGTSYTLQFNSVGSVSYYDKNLNNPSKSFKTGVINVQ